MKAQQKELSGCASNFLAHEDLGKFEEAHHWNIQAKLYNENSTSIWKWQNKRLSIMKNMVLFWSTSVEKEIVALSQVRKGWWRLWFPHKSGWDSGLKGHKKKEREKAQKNERKREKGQCYYPFSMLVLQSSTLIFMIESLLWYHSYTSANFSL